MSEVMRWKLKGFLPGVEGMCKAVMRPEVVMASDFDAAQSELAALREELAVAKRNEHNSEVAYKAAIEKQEELREERNELSLRASRLKVDNENYDRLLVRKSNQCDALQQRLAAAEQRNEDDQRDAERYRKLRKVTPYRFKKMQDTSVTDGGDVLYFHADRFDALMDAELTKPTESGASE